MADEPAQQGRSSRPTLAEIAAEAGVSLPTVSRVVNRRGQVAPATRARVEQLLGERNYRPPGSRRAGHAGLIDIVFARLDTPWAMEILRGVEEWCATQGLGIAVSAARPGGARPSGPVSSLGSHHTDGVLLALVELPARQLAELRADGIPVVEIDPVDLPEPDLPSVGSTNWAGGMAATDHLIARGHTRIAAVGGPRAYLSSRARIDGYRSALDLAGLAYQPHLVRHGDFEFDSGFDDGSALLALPDPPTAIVASSDQQALGVYEAARRLGLAIPQDLSVVGFDDTPMARWSAPALTTVRQPLAEMGRVAAGMLGTLIDGLPLSGGRMELVTELVVRGSTTCPSR